LDANASAIIALQLVKKSSLQLPISQSEYYFCVDNSVSKRRFLANQVFKNFLLPSIFFQKK